MMLLPRFWIGFSVGFGAGVFAREVIPGFRNTFRPVAKTAIKGSMRLLFKGQEILHRMAEFVEDSAAEARTELHDEVSTEAGGQIESEGTGLTTGNEPKEEGGERVAAG